MKRDVLLQQPITKTPEMGEEEKVVCNIVTTLWEEEAGLFISFSEE